MNSTERSTLIAEAHKLIDRVEILLLGLVDSIKTKEEGAGEG